MSRGTVNKIILVGRLGGDPEVRQSTNGTLVASLNLATNDRRRDAEGNWQDHTEWHRVVVFGRTAEIARDYLKKGSRIYLEGMLRTRKWQDKNNQEHYTTEIVANDLQMLDRSGAGSSGGEGDPGPWSEPPTESKPRPRATSSSGPRYGAGQNGFTSDPIDIEDDIPF